jgi:hypothetical protein
MARRLTADVSEELEDVDISQFRGEGQARMKAEWDTSAGLYEAVEAVNLDEVFPDYEIGEIREDEAPQVGVYEGEDFKQYSFASSEYHLRIRDHDIGWKKSEIEFIALKDEDYEEDIAFYHQKI